MNIISLRSTGYHATASDVIVSGNVAPVLFGSLAAQTGRGAGRACSRLGHGHMQVRLLAASAQHQRRGPAASRDAWYGPHAAPDTSTARTHALNWSGRAPAIGASTVAADAAPEKSDLAPPPSTPAIQAKRITVTQFSFRTLFRTAINLRTVRMARFRFHLQRHSGRCEGARRGDNTRQRPLTSRSATGHGKRRNEVDRKRRSWTVLMSTSPSRLVSRSITAHWHYVHFLLHVILFVVGKHSARRTNRTTICWHSWKTFFIMNTTRTIRIRMDYWEFRVRRARSETVVCFVQDRRQSAPWHSQMYKTHARARSISTPRQLIYFKTKHDYSRVIVSRFKGSLCAPVNGTLTHQNSAKESEFLFMDLFRLRYTK